MRPVIEIYNRPKPRTCVVFAALAGWVLSASPATFGQASSTYDPEPPVPKGMRLVEGDILVPLEFDKASYGLNLWPNGVVPYEFDPNVSPANGAAIQQAMNDWQSVANVHFVAHNGEADYVHIQNSTGNNSRVGRIGGKQIINIASWGAEFRMAHELGHCLGFFHEHQRPDRLVQILTANAQSSFQNQFTVDTGVNTYAPYDFDSVMHYDQCAFSNCCPAGSTCGCSGTNCITIQVQPPFDTEWQTRIGAMDHLSYWDRLVMSFLYAPSDWRFADVALFDPNQLFGTFLWPFSSFAAGYSSVPNNGTLVLRHPGTYVTGGARLNKSVRIKAPLGAHLSR